jgi:large subunit ribosomal protein L3
VPYPAGILTRDTVIEEAPAPGLVDDAAVHEIPALPGADEVEAIAAEQAAGAEADTTETTDAPAGEQTPESKEG